MLRLVLCCLSLPVKWREIFSCFVPPTTGSRFFTIIFCLELLLSFIGRSNCKLSNEIYTISSSEHSLSDMYPSK